MKIIHIIPTLNIGGAEKFVVDLCNALSEKTINKVYLIVFFKIETDNILSKSLSDKIEVIELNKKLGFDIKILFRLYKILHKIKPDVVNTHIGSFEYLIIYFFMFFKKTYFFHTIHSDAYFETKNKYLRLLKKITFKLNLSYPITISLNSSESYNKAYGLNNDKLIQNGSKEIAKTINYPFVEKEFQLNYRLTENTTILVNVARIQPVKNQLNLVKAVESLIEKGRDIVLLIIGETDNSYDLKQELLSYSSNRIFFLGQKGNVSDYLLLSDIFCLTSFKEGMPISLIEAFSGKKICICTPAGGMNNMIINNVNGFITNDFNEESIESAINKALQIDLEAKENLKNNIYSAFIENYSIEKTAQEYITFYNEITEKGEN